MGQREFLQGLDDEIVDDFENAGMSDSATYTPSTGGKAIPCRVLVHRGIALTGADGQAMNVSVAITAFATDIGNAKPNPGSRFAIGTEVFTVDSLAVESDESRHVCIVKVGN